MSKILRAVIDTNCIMAAILSAQGGSAKLVDWMTREEDYFKLLLSHPVWSEYIAVADWLIPDSRKHEKTRILKILYFQSEWIEPKLKLDECKDQTDNCFLECAVAGNADYLVTKNIRHFPLKEFAGIKIVVRIRDF